MTRRRDRALFTSGATLDEVGRRLRDARAAVQEQRQGNSESVAVIYARHRLLEVLEEYIANLGDRRLPVPRRMQQEVQLYRRLAGR